MSELTVHILFHGFAICGKPGVPGTWGEGHRWCRMEEREDATCPDCLIEARIADAISDGLGHGPLRALLRLLRKAVAWRRQGHISAWKTPPSRALACWVDTLFETMPELVAAVAPLGVAKDPPALPAPADPLIIQRGSYVDADGKEVQLHTGEFEPPAIEHISTEPELTLSQWSLAVGSRWGRVLHFTDWMGRLSGVEVERADLTDTVATLHLRRGAAVCSHTVPWAVVETGYDDGWRLGIAKAIHQLQQAQPPGA